FISLYTNGWLLTEELVQELTAAGVHNIQISCNYPDERQDRERGIPGLWKKLSKFLPEMAAKGYTNLTVGTFLCHENIDCVVALAPVTRGFGISHSFSTYSRLKNDNHVHELAADQIEKARRVVRELLELKKRYKNVLVSDEYLSFVPEFYALGQHPGCTAGD